MPAISRFCGFSIVVLLWTAPVAFSQAPRTVAPHWLIKKIEKREFPVTSGTFSNDSRFLIFGRGDNTIQAWDTATGKKAFDLAGNRVPPDAFAFTADGKTLLMGEMKKVSFWDWSTRNEREPLTGLPERVRFLALTPDGKKLLTESGNELKRWDLEKRSVEAAWRPTMPLNALDFAPDRKSMALLGGPFTLHSWSLEQQAATLSWHTNKRLLTRVAYAPDGLLVATGGADGALGLVDSRSWKQQVRLPLAKALITALAFAPDSKTLAAGDVDGKVYLWDVTTLDVPAPVALEGHSIAVTFLQFSPDGKWLAGGARDGSMCLWRVERGEWFASATKFVPPQPVAGASPRLALVSTERGDAIQNALTLAEAQLSEARQLQLIDRRALDKVLAEQKLSLAGFVKADQVVALGKLLGADLFAVVETDAVQKKATGLVIFHAGTGVRLWDASLADGNLQDTVADIVHAARAAVQKLQKAQDELKTVCLTTVRNVDLPRDQDAYCDTIGFLLERSLLSSPQLALLERTRLEQVTKERNVPADAPLQQLLAALVRVEVEIQRSETGKGSQATALLFDSRGKLLGKPRVESATGDAVELADKLAAAVSKAIDVAPGKVALDRLREALRFSHEAEFFHVHRDIDRELRAREAAVALNPIPQQRNALAQVLQRKSMELLAGNPFAKPPSEQELHKALVLLQRAVDERHIVEAAWRQTPEVFDEPHAGFTLGTFTRMAPRLAGTHTPATRELNAAIYENYVRLLELRFQTAFAGVTDKKTFEALTERMTRSFPFSISDIHGLTPDAHKGFMGRQLTRWLDVAEKFGAPPLSATTVERVSHILAATALAKLDPASIERYRTTLRAHADPTITVHDAMLDCWLELSRPKIPAAEQEQRLRQFRLLIQKIIASPAGQQSPDLRRACYQAFHTVVAVTSDNNNLLGFTAPYPKELCALCDFMIAQRDLYPPTIDVPTMLLARVVTREGEKQSFDYVNRMLRVMDAPNYHFLTDGATQGARLGQEQNARANLLRRRQQILSRFPDFDSERVDAWANVQELVDVLGARAGIVRLAKPIVHEKAVYVIALGATADTPADRFVQLLCFDLADGRKTSLGQIALDTGFRPPTEKELLVYSDHQNRPWEPTPFAVDAVIYNGHYYLGTSSKGILAFALDGKNVEQIDTRAGLPSDRVQSLACLDGKLFAALGDSNADGYLLKRDLQTKQTTLLASSRRQEQLSPFDDSPGWKLDRLVADPERQRVLFTINIGAAKMFLTGWWEIDGKTQALRQLRETRGGIEWLSPIHAGKILIGGHFETTLLDLATGKFDTRPFEPTKALAPYVETRLQDLVALFGGSGRVCPGHFLHHDWLWCTTPHMRISCDGQTKQLLTSPRRRSTLPFRPDEGFVLIDNRVLLADAYGIWLASFAPAR